jgi:NitT/TauT family transport system substrate-binding protein
MSKDKTRTDRIESTTNYGVNRRAFLSGSAVAGVGALAGCLGTGGDGGGNATDGGGTTGGTASGNGGGSATTSLTIGYQPFYTEAWSALVIKHAGLAEKYLPSSVSVDGWEIALQGSIVGQRMISGDNTIGYTGDMPTITAIANNKRPISAVGLAGFSRGQQCNLGVLPADSDIDSASALGGGDFGVTTGACTHRFMLRMAEQEGLDYNIRDQGINSILAGIRQNNLTIGFGWEPVMSRAVQQAEEGEFLLTGASYDIPDAAGIIMPDSLVQDSPEVAKAWMKAELEAKHIMRSDHERTVDLVAQEQELSDYNRQVLQDVMYTNLDLNPDVDRLEFVTDYGAVESAGTLLRENGPQYLMSQGFIEEIPGDSRYKLGPLDGAAEELSAEVDWTPADGREGNASNEGGTDSTGGTNTTDNTTSGSNMTTNSG